MESACTVIPAGKPCPSALRQATAESMAVVHEIMYPETLDERVLSVFNKVIEAVKERWKEKLQGRSPQSIIVYVMGKWGYGKTHYGIVLEKIAKSEGISAKRVLFNRIIDEAREGRWRDPGDLRDRIAEILLEGSPRDKPVIVILDEFESLVSAGWAGSEAERVLIEAFIELYEALVNPQINYHEDLRGRLHLVLLLTPAASIKLEQMLAQAFKKGKIKSRYDFIIHLRPLTKEKSAILVERHIRESLGLGLRDILARPEYLNAIYYVTGGIPRILLYVLRELARAAEERCGEGPRCCICPLDAPKLLRALAAVRLVDPEGESYTPVTHYLASLLDTLEDDLLDPIASFEPIDESLADRLSSTGITYNRGRVYGPLTGAEAARWVDEFASRLCSDKGECVEELSQIAQYLIFYSGDHYYVILPPTREELGEWLYTLGWTTGQVPRSLDIGEVAPRASMRYAYVLPPKSARALYKSPLEGAFDFVLDPSLRIEVQRRLDRLNEKPERLYQYAAKGVAGLLRLRGEVIVPGIVEEGGSIVYRYEEAGVSFNIPIEILSEEGARGKPTSIVIEVSRGPPGSDVDGNRIIIKPRESDLRLLAAIAVSLEASENPYRQIDLARLEELGRYLFDSVEFSNSLEAAVSNLVERGIIVRPLDHSDVFKGRSTEERFRALGDILKFLAVLGGKTRYVPVRELADFIWNFTYITPYGRSRGKWCGISFIEVGRFSDIKDPESKERLERIIAQALAALTAEKLVEKTGTPQGPGYMIKLDAIAERLYQLAVSDARLVTEHSEKVLEDIADRFYILPSDRTNKSIAMKRLALRRELLRYLDMAPRQDNSEELAEKLKEILYSKRLDERLSVMQQSIEYASRRLEEVTGDSVDDIVGVIVYCKGAGRGDRATCKVIDYDLLANVEKLIRRTVMTLLSNPNGIVYQSYRYINTLDKMAGSYTRIIQYAANDIASVVNEMLTDVDTLKDKRELIRTVILSSELYKAKRFYGIIEEETQVAVERARESVRETLKNVVRIARLTLETARTGRKSKVKDIAMEYSFTRCMEGGYRMAALLYNPLARLLKKEDIERSARAEILEIERLLDEIYERIQDLVSLHSVRGVSLETIEKMVIRGYEDYTKRGLEGLKAIADSLARTVDNFKLYEENYRKALEKARVLKEKSKTVEELLVDIENALYRLSEDIKGLEEFLSRMSRHEPYQGFTTILDELTRLKDDLAQIMSKHNELSGILRQYSESCRDIEPLLESRLEECLKWIKSIEPGIRDLEIATRKLESYYAVIVKSLWGEIEKNVADLKKTLEALRSVCLRELQEGREVAREAVISAAKGLEVLSRIRPSQDLEDLEKAVSLLDEAYRSYRHARGNECTRTFDLLFSVLDAIRSRGKLRLEELIGILEERAGESSIGTLLEELVEMAKTLGISLSLVLETE